MIKKYKLIEDDTIEYCGYKLKRIEYLTTFGDINIGDKGGYIESEYNLSHHGNCYIGGNAKVYDNAQVHGFSDVYGNTHIHGNTDSEVAK